MSIISARGLVIVLVAALPAMVLPLITQPSHANQVIHDTHFQISAGVGIFMLLFCGVLMVLKSGSSLSKETKSLIVNGAMAATVVAVLLAYGAFYLSENVEAQSKWSVQMHGKRTMATVQSLYDTGCGRNGCNVAVAYEFTVDRGFERRRYASTALLGNTRYNSQLEFAREESQVPIAYDTMNPAISFLNFNDSVFTRDPFATARGLQGIVAGFAAMVCMMFLCIFYVAKLKFVDGE